MNDHRSGTAQDARTSVDATLARFAGAGGLPPRRDLLLVTAVLTTTAETTLGDGTGGDSLADTTVRRDPWTGLPMIPAPSLTGVLNHRLTELTGAATAERLFGSTERPAALEPRDALARTEPTPWWRVGNAVAPATRTVRAGGLFTDEVVPAGTEFALLWALWVPVEDPGLAREVVAAALFAADQLTAGEIAVGRRTRVGRGALTASGWRARWFPLSTDYTACAVWYGTPYDETAALTAHLPAHPTLSATVGEIRDGRLWSAPIPAVEGREARLIITGDLRAAERIGERVVESTARLAPTADGGLRDSGAQVKALLRATAGRVLEHIALGEHTGDTSPPGEWNRAEAIVRARRLQRDLFGSHPAEADRAHHPEQPIPFVLTPSRLAVNEAVPVGARAVTLHRVHINPLTRAPVTGRKGEIAAHYGGARPLKVTVARADERDRGLLVLVLKDLCDGRATLGGPHRRHLAPDTVTMSWLDDPDDDGTRQEVTGWPALAGQSGRAVDALVDWIRYGRS